MLTITISYLIKNLPVMQEARDWSLGQEDLLEKGIPTSVFLPGKFHGQRSLASCSPWGRKELDTTEQLTLSFSWVPSPWNSSLSSV